MKRRMGFFVPQTEEPNQESNNEPPSERLDLIILANAKREGLSFRELNEFRVRDYIEYSDIYIGKNKNKNTVRNATQSDIDKLLG